jgi:hypothetical protein
MKFSFGQGLSFLARRPVSAAFSVFLANSVAVAVVLILID